MPHPASLFTALVLMVLGALINPSLGFLFVVWIVCAVGLYFSGLIASHIKFIVAAVLPLYLALLLVWVVIVKGAPPNSNLSGFEYANHIAVQILLIGAMFQWTFIPLYEKGELVQSLAKCGLPVSTITILSSAIITIEDVRRRARQVGEARIARGLLSTSFFGRLRQLASILAPLFVSMIDSSIKRAELWEHRKLYDRVLSKPQSVAEYSMGLSAIFLCASSCWLGFSIWSLS